MLNNRYTKCIAVQNPKIDGVRKAFHQRSSDVTVNSRPLDWQRCDFENLPLKFVEKFSTKAF